jgi:hypothetical protein
MGQMGGAPARFAKHRTHVGQQPALERTPPARHKNRRSTARLRAFCCPGLVPWATAWAVATLTAHVGAHTTDAPTHVTASRGSRTLLGPARGSRGIGDGEGRRRGGLRA